MENRSDRLTGLDCELLMALLVDEETTLLLVELVNHLDPGTILSGPATEYPEIDILGALDRLSAQNLVTSRVEQLEGPMNASGGVPEYALGREQVFWWRLTEGGRSVATQCRASRDST